MEGRDGAGGAGVGRSQRSEKGDCLCIKISFHPWHSRRKHQARYGKATEEVLHGKEKRVPKTGILFDLMPEVFTRDQLKLKMNDLKIMSKNRDVIWRWSNSKLIEMLPDGSFKKIGEAS